MDKLISIAAALALAAAAGYGIGDYRATRRALRPKTLKQLMREQRVRPVRSINDLPSANPEVFSAEDLDAWDTAMKEARG